MTMFKTEEEIARELFLKHCPTDTSKHAMLTIYDMDILVSSVYTQAQQDIKEACGKGFDEYCYKEQIDDETHQFDIDEAKSLWQACSFHHIKTIETLKQRELGYQEDLRRMSAKLKEKDEAIVSKVNKIIDRDREIAGKDAEIERLGNELKQRAKQIGVACLEHDLSHSLACGRCLEYAKDRIEEKDEEIERLRKLVYVGNVFNCPKCKLRLVATTISMADGGFYKNTEPQKCPNSCGPMWMQTYQDEVKKAMGGVDEIFNKYQEAVKDIEVLIGLIEEGCKVYDQHVPSGSSSFRLDAECERLKIKPKYGLDKKEG